MNAQKWIESFDATNSEELTPSFDFTSDLMDNYCEDSFRDINMLTPEDVFYTFDQEITYRASDISIVQQSSVRVTSSSGYDFKESSIQYSSISKPTLSKVREEIKIVPLTSSSSFVSAWGSILDSYSNGSNDMKVGSNQPSLQERPLYLIDTHFVCDRALAEIVERVNHVLNAVNEVSFEFDPSIYKVGCLNVVTSFCFNKSLFANPLDEMSLRVDFVLMR